CINHVNLATAGAARRAREIGTRKILGATRTALALRFIAESLALSVAALFVALLVVELVVPRTPIADWLGAATPLRPTSEPVVLERIPTVEDELLGDDRIRGATSANQLPGFEGVSSFMDMETNDGSVKGVPVNHLQVQQNFARVLGMRIAAGRDLSAKVAT